MLPSFETFFASFSDFIPRLFASDWHPRPLGARANFFGRRTSWAGAERKRAGVPARFAFVERSGSEVEGRSKGEVKEFALLLSFYIYICSYSF